MTSLRFEVGGLRLEGAPSNLKPPTSNLLLCALIVAVAVTVTTPASGQSRVSTSAAPFLTVGTGARGSALGHAYTAITSDADALFWNPAGAARPYDPRNRGSAFFSHTRWLLDTQYNAFGIVIPVTRSGVVGLSMAQMDYGRMDVRTVELPDGTGETFGANDFVIGMSYAQPLTDAFYIGGTLKYVSQTIYDMSARTMAFDVGFILDSPYFNGMRVAASIMNFGGLMEMRGVNSRIFVDVDDPHQGSNDAIPAELEMTKWDLPLSFKFGLDVPVVATSSFRIDLLSDAHQTNDNSLNADLGAQVRYSIGSLNLDLRGGYKDLPLENVYSHLTFGGGIDLRISGLRFGADYAHIPFEQLGNVSMLDVRLNF